MSFTFRTEETLERAVDELVKEEGLSRQEIIRRPILDHYERAGRAKKVADSTDHLVKRLSSRLVGCRRGRNWGWSGLRDVPFG